MANKNECNIIIINKITRMCYLNGLLIFQFKMMLSSKF